MSNQKEYTVSTVMEVLDSGGAEEKAAMLEDIREKDIRDTALAPLLIDRLEKETSRAIKERILMILNRLVPLGEYRDADRMLRSPDPFVRNGIVEIIKSSDIPIIRFLEKLAEDEDKDVRKFVIDALSQEESEDAIAIIRARLDDTDTNIVYTAIEYLGSFRDAPSVEKIEAILLASNHSMVLCSGLEALSKIQRSYRREEVLEKFMDGEADPITIFPLLKYLSAFGDNNAFAFIGKLLEKNQEMFAKEIIDTLNGILTRLPGAQPPPYLRDRLELMQQTTTNSVNKYAIAKLLMRAGTGENGEAGHAGQLEKVRAMLGEGNEMVKLCAVELLADIGDESDIERLEEIAEDSESDELLEAIGDTVAKIAERLE
jgi:HEAT repeat protein